MKRISVDDIVGLAEIADLLGRTSKAMWQLKQRHPDFPRPVRTLRCGPVWNAEEVQSWANEHGYVTEI